MRYLPDGSVVFLGRNDHQFKIRGFSSEIEARLLAHPDVREVVVIALGQIDSRLVAYTVNDAVQPGALRDWLAPCLPDYMAPGRLRAARRRPPPDAQWQARPPGPAGA
ncbi:hypothetical protein ACFQVB_43760 [Paraburkholderia humisilvae]|uniref:AMP-binding enzyme n=1 Tax=Paraburkholderia humisilvae TaxID=627669 RepID=UPI0031B59F4C